MDINNLRHEKTRYEELRRRILEADPEIDTPTLADTLEGETDLHAMLASAARSIIEDQDCAQVLRLRIDALQARLGAYALRASRKRDIILETMEACNIRQIREADFTVSTKAGAPNLVVLDESAVPEWYFIPQPPKLDRSKLLGTLRVGEHVPGVTLSNSKIQLQIRTK